MSDSFREAVFVIGEINGEIDFSKPPTSGEDYIKRVVVEAQQCDDIVVANIDSKKLKSPDVPTETVKINKLRILKKLAGCVEAPATLSPTLEWQNCQVANFSELRLYVAKLEIERKNCRDKNKSEPNKENQKGWINFCLGSDDEQVHFPTLDTIFCIKDHIQLVDQLLEYLVEEVESQGLTTQLGRWIYALLSVVDLPLDPDVCSCLRKLARACSRARANLVRSHQLIRNVYYKLFNDAEVSTMNLFICLVARYFRQLDLADP
ncbi:GSCOCG00008785001-RA-CDS [Cotesia congregata]|nr:GSCOCG00008785001-RA-CDS [Cotesia congregata]